MWLIVILVLFVMISGIPINFRGNTSFVHKKHIFRNELEKEVKPNC